MANVSCNKNILACINFSPIGEFLNVSAAGFKLCLRCTYNPRNRHESRINLHLATSKLNPTWVLCFICIIIKLQSHMQTNAWFYVRCYIHKLCYLRCLRFERRLVAKLVSLSLSDIIGAVSSGASTKGSSCIDAASFLS